MLILLITHLFLTLSNQFILSVTIPEDEIPKQSIQIQSRNFAVTSEACAITNCGGNGFCQINKQGYNVCHCAKFWSGERCGTMDMAAIFDRARSGSWLKSVDIEKYCKNYSSSSYGRAEFEINHEMFKIIAITFFSGCFFTLSIACLVLCCSKLIQRPEGKRSEDNNNNNYAIRQATANINGSSQAPLILTSNAHKDNLSCTSSNENSTRMHHHINLPTTNKKPQKPKPKNILKIAKCNSLERKVPSAYINSKSMEVLNHSL